MEKETKLKDSSKMSCMDVHLGKYRLYRKLSGGIWYKHAFTRDAMQLTFPEGKTFWARHSDINRYSRVIKCEIYL